jgi:hypothetical protein
MSVGVWLAGQVIVTLAGNFPTALITLTSGPTHPYTPNAVLQEYRLEITPELASAPDYLEAVLRRVDEGLEPLSWARMEDWQEIGHGAWMASAGPSPHLLMNTFVVRRSFQTGMLP